MNAQFKAKLLQKLAAKKSNKGFTLIELLVVVIIVGVLAAVALPNLLNQVGKAREVEGKNAVGSINRAQQTFHFERRTFADATDVTDQANPLGVVVKSDYYTFTVAGGADDATVQADAVAAEKDGVRQYGGGISHAAGAYDTSICQSDDIGGDATASAAAGDAGCAGGTEIEGAAP